MSKKILDFSLGNSRLDKNVLGYNFSSFCSEELKKKIDLWILCKSVYWTVLAGSGVELHLCQHLELNLIGCSKDPILDLCLFFGHSFFCSSECNKWRVRNKILFKGSVWKLKIYVSNYFIINIINFKYSVIIILYFLFLEFYPHMVILKTTFW